MSDGTEVDGEEERPMGCLAAGLFLAGLVAAGLAFLAGGVFLWPVAVEAAGWAGWLLKEHPGMVMLTLAVAAGLALAASRLLDGGGRS